MRIGRLILMQLLVIAGLGVIGAVGWYYWHLNYTYVITQDASITAPSIPMVAMASGSLTSISVKPGETVASGQVIGQETMPVTRKGAGATTTTVNLTAPVAGVIATVDALPGAPLAAGTPILTEVQLGRITVVANVPETRIRNIHPGNTATIYVDAHPGVSFSGTVKNIQPTTQSFFSLLPTSATAGNFTKVTQRIPVTLSIDSAGYTLLPGESCEVKIQIR